MGESRNQSLGRVTRCNTPERAATRCNALQRAATQYNALQRAALLVQLVSMGFHENGCKRAALAVENASAEVRLIHSRTVVVRPLTGKDLSRV